ncbi:MAG TPA: hypothetical protein VLI41_02210 [Phenylobacterium sp.]|uniref:hypothetical protein n=1 Tax=Phenylobacterium sp. TaxID=1871053 RepID=UPI002C221255|nr:hypothetical protein [Phenylobacterium sp.]HSV01994.1 hypothetical protein [Phenylobacterium sp.]
MATGQQGTGRHGHKDSQEPWPHTKGSSSDGKENRAADGRDGASRSASKSEQESLKEREYRDDKGQVHHHTRTYEQQHKDDRR